MSGGNRRSERTPEEARLVFRNRVIFWAVFGPILVLCVLAVSTLTTRFIRAPEVSHALRTSKSIGYALWNFEQEYGAFPNEETAEKLKLEHPEMPQLLGTESSNDFLRQLHVAGFVDVDSIFNDLPRERSQSLETFLGPGECHYAYVVWEKTPPAGAPLLVAPVKAGQKALGSKFSSRAVVLRVDMSVSDPRIRPGGKDFFDWSQPHWGGQRPRIVWPE